MNGHFGSSGMTEKTPISQLVPPHGGHLVPCILAGAELAAEQERARSLPVLRMSSRETSDLIMMATGAFSPLKGFMRRDDYGESMRNMRLSDGTLWPIPVTLSTSAEQADGLREGREAALVDDETGTLMGSMLIEEKFGYDKETEAREVFRTADEDHPGVKKVYDQGDVLLGGPVKAFSELDYPERFGR
jgi:sulfate adenylyltransferase